MDDTTNKTNWFKIYDENLSLYTNFHKFIESKTEDKDDVSSVTNSLLKIYCSKMLKNFREYFNFSQSGFAKIIGVTRNMVCNCEAGKSVLTYQNLFVANAMFNEYIDKENLSVVKHCFAFVMLGMCKLEDISKPVPPVIVPLSSSPIDFKKPRALKPVTPIRLMSAKSLRDDVINENLIPCGSFTYTKLEEPEEPVMKLYNQLSKSDQSKIMERMEYIISTYNNEDMIPTKRIAVLGQTACGNPIEAIEIADEFIETNELKASFALRAVGNSMSPLINDGDVILVKQTEELEINDIGIFQINESGFSDDEAVTCKMLKSVKDGIMTLIALNTAYDPIVIDTKKHNIKIIGKYLCKA